MLRLVGHTDLITAQSQVESRLAQTEEMIEELQGTLSVSRAAAKALSNERRLEDTNFEVSSLADQQYALARDAAALALAAELLSDAADRFNAEPSRRCWRPRPLGWRRLSPVLADWRCDAAMTGFGSM